MLRTLPVDRRDYSDEMAVLAAERRTALSNQLRQLYSQCCRRLWTMKASVVFVTVAALIVLLFGLSGAEARKAHRLPSHYGRGGIRTSSSTS